MDIKIKLSREENIQYFGTEEVILDLERYLRGVVASEIGNSHVEACAAQAIASRTYALNTIAANGYITDKSSTHQAFRASRLTGYDNAYKGVELTQGEILIYNNKIAQCYYYASNGGKTTSSKERWGGDYAYLISQIDEYDKGPKNGHGVGMSQQGTKARASAGHTHQQILQFYFPNTSIEKEVEATVATNNEEKIANWCNRLVGQGYIYGAKGQTVTEGFIQQQYNQYPDYVDPKVVRKWLGKKAYDCAQFVRYAMKEVGISLVSGATSQWNKTNWEQSGTIDSLPKNKICCLYRWTGSVMQHTGVYQGDGSVIDARGSSSGIVKTKLESYKWTHWGIPKGLYATNTKQETTTQEVLKVLYKAKVIANSGSTVRLRESMSSTAKTIAKIPVGTIVDVVEDNNGWDCIVYDGKTGYMMDEFLEKVEEVVTEYYVKIKCASAQEAKRLAELLGTATA